MNIIKKVEKIIKEKASPEDWNYHIKQVVKYSLFLAKKYKYKDLKQVELAALLHDVGRLKYSDKKDIDHHITGVKKANKILTKLKYDKEKTKEILQAIVSHRGSDKIKPKTMLDKIIANADAMSHYDALPVFYFWRSQQGDSFQEITDWIINKYKRNWNKKLSLPEAKKAVRKKHEENLKILNEIKKIYRNNK